MAETLLYSIIESPTHPRLSSLYNRLDIHEVKLTSMRKAISELRRQVPDVVVADFIYGYGNNYAGVNICNLDVFLYSLQKYAPDARVIVLADKSERGFADQLQELFPLHAILQKPVTAAQMEALLLPQSSGAQKASAAQEEK